MVRTTRLLLPGLEGFCECFGIFWERFVGVSWEIFAGLESFEIFWERFVLVFFTGVPTAVTAADIMPAKDLVLTDVAGAGLSSSD